MTIWYFEEGGDTSYFGDIFIIFVYFLRDDVSGDVAASIMTISVAEGLVMQLNPEYEEGCVLI